MKGFFVTLLVLFCLAFNGDPGIMTMREILATARKDERVLLNQKAETYLQSHPLKLPILKQLELRYGPDDLYFDQQRIALRLEANGWGEIKHQGLLHNSEYNVLIAESTQLLEEALSDRYKILAALYYDQQKLKAHQKLETLLSDQTKVLNYLNEAGDKVDVTDLVETEEDMTAAASEILGLNANIEQKTQMLQQLLGTDEPIVPAFEAFISIEKITLVKDRWKNTLPAATPDLVTRQREIQLSRAALQLEKAKRYDILNFLQFDYRSPRSDPFETKRDFSVRIGVDIPIAGNSRLRQNELGLKILTAENRYQWEQELQQKQIALELSKLEGLLQQYNFRKEKWLQSPSRKVLENSALQPELTASDLLRLRINLQKQEIKLVELAYDITQSYLDLLSLTGAITTPPLRNYLSMEEEEL